MRYYSTGKQSPYVSLREAVLTGMPRDNGLFMPESIPRIPSAVMASLHKMTFCEVAVEVCKLFFGEDIPLEDIKKIVSRAFSFEPVVREIYEDVYILELFHGPTLAFKDFGACFMAQLMAYLIKDTDTHLHVLVATSGDTGSAVGRGFWKIPNIDVTILYPSGKVSEIQEKQLTTIGENVVALEVDGTFDDCQRLVKQAFLDEELRNHVSITSANSINIARLIPQIFYYVYAYGRLKNRCERLVVSVPSGNFGNLTAGLIAHKMGIPIQHFVAATNVNDIVPKYLQSGEFIPRPSLMTISNAMDVGDPSNFRRMVDICGEERSAMAEQIFGVSYDDEATKATIKDVFERYNYLLDPHSAIGMLGLEEYMKKGEKNTGEVGVFLGTAHPAKFLDIVNPLIEGEVEIPPQLHDVLLQEKKSELMPNDYVVFRKKIWDLKRSQKR
jgi:threonine synthase